MTTTTPTPPSSTRKRGRSSKTAAAAGAGASSPPVSASGGKKRAVAAAAAAICGAAAAAVLECRGERKDGGPCNRKAKGDCAHGRCVACCERLGQPCAAHEALIRKRQGQWVLYDGGFCDLMEGLWKGGGLCIKPPTRDRLLTRPGLGSLVCNQKKQHKCRGGGHARRGGGRRPG